MTESLIKDILVIGIRDDKAREKLLAKEQLDLETCIDTLKMLEITHAYTHSQVQICPKQVNNEQFQKSPKYEAQASLVIAAR